MRLRTLQRLLIALVVSSSAFMAGGSGPVAASSTVTKYEPGRLLTATRLDVRQEAPSASAASTRSHGARSTHAVTPGAVAATPSAATAANSAAASTLVHNFNGVSSRDSAVTNFGAEFEPPDQGLCVGNGFVLEAVNSAYTIYRPDGRAVVGPFNVNDIFNVGAKEFTSDPRCYFDKTTDTWFATILFINSASTVSAVDVAVSTSGDPTKLWNVFRFDTTDNGANGEPKNHGCPCLGDQPTLGIDGANLYVTTNEFSLLGPQFNGAQVYAIAKSDLVAGHSRAHVVHFGNLHIGGSLATSVQPALTTGAAPAEYMLSSLDPGGTSDNRLGVWALTDTAAVASGGSPVLSSEVIGSQRYGLPPAAAQKGSRSRLDSGDDRMQQTQFIHNTLWGELTTALTVGRDRVRHAGAAWFAVQPHLSGAVLAAAAVTAQGYEAQAGHDVLYPALQATASGSAVMIFTLTGATMYPSAAYAVLRAGAAAFSSPLVAGHGTGPYSAASTRWGDYSFAVLAPDGVSVWTATEYVPQPASQTPDGVSNWGTRVMDVCAC